jgi:hypothetical protein
MPESATAICTPTRSPVGESKGRESRGEDPFGSFEQGERKLLNVGWGEVRRRDGTIIKQ